MSWTRVGALLPAVLAACAKVNALDDRADAGSVLPSVAQVEPQPGKVEPGARFTVRFSTAVDEGQLLAPSGKSETVVLARDADVERAAAAIEHPQLSAHERALLLSAVPQVARDRASITLTPDEALAPGKIWLLVSPRLKDDVGRKLLAARFAFEVAAPASTGTLIFPVAGGEAPANLERVRARADSGRLSVRGPAGEEVGAAEAVGETAIPLMAPLTPGARYVLALDGEEDPAQAFTLSPCARNSAPALARGSAPLSVRDTAVVADLTLDWPARVELRVGPGQSEPCGGECAVATTYVACAVKACGPQSFECRSSLRVDGLQPAQDYALRVVLQDDLGHEGRGPLQKFSTVAPLPRLIISEVMAAPAAPRAEAEYVELLNLGPGSAVLDPLALVSTDGIVRPLLATAPPTPVLLAPGARALAVGSSFAATRYPSLPPGTPVLRASTHRLLGHGLHGTAPPAFTMMLGAIELTRFPGGAPVCPAGASLQRDESAPPDADGPWSCGPVGGTPGAPP